MDVAVLLDSIGRLPELALRLERLEVQMSRLVEATPVRRFVDIGWICAELGCSRDWIRSRPWVLPNFGVAEVSGSPKRWKLETWREWSDELGAREQAWRSLSTAERSRLARVSR